MPIEKALCTWHKRLKNELKPELKEVREPEAQGKKFKFSSPIMLQE